VTPVFSATRQRLRPETALGTEYPVNVSGNGLRTDLAHVPQIVAKNIPTDTKTALPRAINQVKLRELSEDVPVYLRPGFTPTSSLLTT